MHYLTGLPPVRSGGMINYALDLAVAQEKTDEVYLLLPGRISICESRYSNVKITRKGKWQQIPIFRIRNPLPIPMANGISDVALYTIPCKGNVYSKFLANLKPDIIHIHTFMGLHAEFLEAAVQMRIPVIYTTHNYFGICPKADMMCGDQICSCPGMNCAVCSRAAFSKARIVLEQSYLYSLYCRNPFLVKMMAGNLLKSHFQRWRSNPVKKREAGQSVKSAHHQNYINEHAERKYQDLLNYYRRMFRNITWFHFNSANTHKIFESFLGKLPGEEIEISNGSIRDRRQKRKTGKLLRVGFLGGDSLYKGLARLQQAMSELYNSGFREMELHIYGSSRRTLTNFCIYHNSYSSAEMEQVFAQIDLLVIPSHGTETFGMVLLEALSFGVPVLVTDKVGAQDILKKSQTVIGKIVPDTIPDLKAAIAEFYLHRSQLAEMNANILKENLQLDYAMHVKQIRIMYERFLTNRAEA